MNGGNSEIIGKKLRNAATSDQLECVKLSSQISLLSSD